VFNTDGYPIFRLLVESKIRKVASKPTRKFTNARLDML